MLHIQAVAILEVNLQDNLNHFIYNYPRQLWVERVKQRHEKCHFIVSTVLFGSFVSLDLFLYLCICMSINKIIPKCSTNSPGKQDQNARECHLLTQDLQPRVFGFSATNTTAQCGLESKTTPVKRIVCVI